MRDTSVVSAPSAGPPAPVAGGPLQSHDCSRPASAAGAVLTGGRGRRLGGLDKTALTVAGIPIVARVLDSLAGLGLVLVCGPALPPTAPRGTRLIREDPPGGGPLAALAAVVEAAAVEDRAAVVVLAGDMPFTAGLPAALLGLLTRAGVQAVVPVDEEGRDQPLAAAYDTAAVRRALARMGSVTGGRLGDLLARLDVLRVPAAHLEPGCLVDVDTPRALAAAVREAALVTARTGSEPRMIDDWTTALAAELGLDPGLVDTSEILDVAKAAAHGVMRPAAPLTTFLVGLAAGRAGGDAGAIAAAARSARDLVARWAPEPPVASQPPSAS